MWGVKFPQTKHHAMVVPHELICNCLFCYTHPTSLSSCYRFVNSHKTSGYINLFAVLPQAGDVRCQRKKCPETTRCSHPVPGRCCPLCDRCMYQGKVYQNRQHFNPDPCVECACQVGVVTLTSVSIMGICISASEVVHSITYAPTRNNYSMKFCYALVP